MELPLRVAPSTSLGWQEGCAAPSVCDGPLGLRGSRIWSWMRTQQHQPLSLGTALVRPVGILLPKCPGSPLGFTVHEQVPRARLGKSTELSATATAGASFTQMSC